MTLFVVSSLVALLGVGFNTVLTRAYQREYGKRIEEVSRKNQIELGYGLSPTVVGRWFDRIADMAGNFPAVVLTLVAFLEIRPFTDSSLASAVLVVAAVTFCLVTVVADSPQKPPPRRIQVRLRRKSILSLSLYTVILIGLNLCGLVLVLVFPDVHGSVAGTS